MLQLKKIRFLSEKPSVTLFEKPFLDYLRRYYRGKNHEKIVSQRYLAFIPKSNDNGILLTVHIDRLGLVYANETFSYSNYYGYELYQKEYKPNVVFGERFIDSNVWAYDARDGKVIGEGIVSNCEIDNKNRLVFKVKNLNLKGLVGPIPIAYKGGISINKDKIIGQIDNVISIYTVYELLRRELGFTILFTTEEEIGMSWRYISEFINRYQYKQVLALDTTSVEGIIDLDDVDIVFRTSDDVAEFGKELVDKLVCFANKREIKYFLKTRSPESSKTRTITEIGRVIKESRHNLEGATIQFPSVKYHTRQETTTLRSLIKIIEFLTTLGNHK